jgi:hypothetical protein
MCTIGSPRSHKALVNSAIAVIAARSVNRHRCIDP